LAIGEHLSVLLDKICIAIGMVSLKINNLGIIGLI